MVAAGVQTEFFNLGKIWGRHNSSRAIIGCPVPAGMAGIGRSDSFVSGLNLSRLLS